MTIPTTTSLDEMLIRGLHDLCYLLEVQGVVYDRLGLTSLEDARPHVVDVVRQMLTRGLFEAGYTQLVDKAGKPFVDFVPWSETVEDQIKKIECAYYDIGDNLNIGDVVWFCLTPLGRSRAEALSPTPHKP